MPRTWFPFAPEAHDRAEVALLTLPFAGGSALAVRSWQAALGGDVQVLAAELPGRGTRLREAPLAEPEQVVEQLLPELEARSAGRPLAIFGHSLGAFLAFDLARAVSPEPLVCFVSGARPPDVAAREPKLHELDDEGFVAALGHLGGTPRAVLEDRELLELFLPALRADFRMAERFERPSTEKIEAPLRVLCGERDEYVDPETMRGWSRFAGDSCSVHVLPGGHFFPAENESEVLALLAEHLVP